MPTEPTTPDEVREQASILHTGRWYIASLETPELAMQAESEKRAIDKLVKRWEDYTSDPPNHEDILLGGTDNPREDRNLDDIPDNNAPR